jgi:hypothetical protein
MQPWRHCSRRLNPTRRVRLPPSWAPNSQLTARTRDKTQDEIDRALFLDGAKTLKPEKRAGDPNRVIAYLVRRRRMALPAPLVKTSSGRKFDGKAALEEIQDRQIGIGARGAIPPTELVPLDNILTAQGAAATGGLAGRVWSGGKVDVYCKSTGGLSTKGDLGSDTSQTASAMKAFNPDG